MLQSSGHVAEGGPFSSMSDLQSDPTGSTCPLCYSSEFIFTSQLTSLQFSPMFFDLASKAIEVHLAYYNFFLNKYCKNEHEVVKCEQMI